MTNPRIKPQRTPVTSPRVSTRWRLSLGVSLLLLIPVLATLAQQGTPYKEPRWMAKMRAQMAASANSSLGSVNVVNNVDVSNEPGPQSETFIAVSGQNSNLLAGASNEIFRNPQRTYFSTDGGNTWIGHDQPLVDAEGTTWSFASDPGVCFDTRGNIFFSQILIASVDNNFKVMR